MKPNTEFTKYSASSGDILSGKLFTVNWLFYFIKKFLTKSLRFSEEYPFPSLSTKF